MITFDVDSVELDGKTVLDLGCGGGRHSFAMARAGAKVVAADLSFADLQTTSSWLAAMRESGEVKPDAPMLAVQADALTLPFQDGAFDVVLASEILEHIPNDEGAMREIERVLAPGGELIVTVPTYAPELVCWALSTDYHNTPGGHVRIYRRSQLLGRLAKVGMRPVRSYHAHALHSPYWWLKCLVGTQRDIAPVRAYHRLLVWEITDNPLPLRMAERTLAPVIGKSFIVHFRRAAADKQSRVGGDKQSRAAA